MQRSLPGSGTGGRRRTSARGAAEPVSTPASEPAASSARTLGASNSSTSSPRSTPARGPSPASYVTSRTRESLNPLHNRDSAGGEDAHLIPRVHPVAAGLLGGVEGGVGARVEVVEVELAAGRHGHAHAHGHLEALGPCSSGGHAQALGDL